MSERWDETWHRLLMWTNSQAQSERLSAQVLLSEGFTSLDPSHPLGGKDGGKDAICIRGGLRWAMASYFPRGQKGFEAIKVKFMQDLAGASTNGAQGIAFVTNQELRLAEREALTEAANLPVELYHLERLTAILDQPSMASVRKQFLQIEDSATSQPMEMQLALVAELSALRRVAEKAAKGHTVGTTDFRLQAERVLAYLQPSHVAFAAMQSPEARDTALTVARELEVLAPGLAPGGWAYNETKEVAAAGYERVIDLATQLISLLSTAKPEFP